MFLSEIKRIIKNNKRTLLLFSSSLLSLIIGVYQIYRCISNGLNQTQVFSPSFILVLFPFFIAVICFLFAILSTKNQGNVTRILNWFSAHRSLVSIIVLTAMIAIIYVMRVFANLDDSLLNLGMEGLGLLFFTHILLLIIHIFTQGYIDDDKNSQSSSRFLLISLLSIFTLWLLMAVTKFGLYPDKAYWNVAGVPVLWIFLALLILLVITYYNVQTVIKRKSKLSQGIKKQSLVDVLIILTVWVSAALIWMKVPYSNSHFITDALPPDGHYWPMSDARLMDLGGQYLIIGGRLETPYFTEKPYYALFLGLLHFFFGQSYQTITNIQILFLALIPVFLYLLGKELSGRAFGIVLSIFAIIKEVIALLSTYQISVSTSRLMMTELPTALLLLIFSFLLFKWYKNNNSGLVLPFVSGLTIGVASFVRTNNIIVLIVFLGFLILFGRPKLSQRTICAGVFLTGALIAMVPWIIYSQVTHQRDPLTWKIQAALSSRFSIPQQNVIESSIDADTSIPDQNAIPSIGGSNDQPNELEIIKPDITYDNNPIINSETEPVYLYNSRVSQILGHFLNNQVKALFVLPIQIYPANLQRIIHQDYWKEPVTWAGNLPAEGIAAFAVNLTLIALGLNYAWKNFKWTGLIPLFVEIAYYLSNALVRTSGSRYLIPADWVVYLYFILGVFVLLGSLRIIPVLEQSQEITPIPSIKNPWVLFVIAALIGLSLPIINLLFPPLYHNESKLQVLERLPMEKITREVGISSEDMQKFFVDENTVFLYGREIYPAYLKHVFTSNDGALTFTLLTPDLYEIAIPYSLELTEKLPAGEDMIVLGCKDPHSNRVLSYLGYFVQSDTLVWSSSTTFNSICRNRNNFIQP